ncbi:unnamed protein product [Schistosoma margrebowiei]|uniref:Uncharacterized protein n=1 Tax=Schistosoma margrebowiei TaxID=48269 RepID=A0A183MED2_9TREM|nr:unnamed protein product [Schistosoma margrebowiei]
MESSRPKRRGISKNTIHWEMEIDMRKMNKNWIELEEKAQDRVGWRMSVYGLCIIRSNRALQTELVCKVLVGGSNQETLDPGFVVLVIYQQGVPVILRVPVLPDWFDPVSTSFTVRDVTTELSESRPTP